MESNIVQTIVWVFSAGLVSGIMVFIMSMGISSALKIFKAV